MINQVQNMMRYVVQAIRKNIKPLILVVSFVTFIWLIADTVHRPEFVRHASKHSFGFGNPSDSHAEQWNQHQVKMFLDMLYKDHNSTTISDLRNAKQLKCPMESYTVFTAFASSSLLDNLWHYFSLISIHTTLTSKMQGHRFKSMLSPTARKALSRLFIRIPFEVIDKDLVECYHFSETYVLNDETHIELSDKNNQLYILNNQTKRLREIMELSWEQLPGFFSLRMDTLKTAYDVLKQLRIREVKYSDSEDALNFQFVGMHVRKNDDLPIEYYFSSITFHRKINDAKLVIFVVICEDRDSHICQILNTHNERIEIIQEHGDTDIDFALMTLVNHTVISNDRDIFPTLLRGIGNTVVYGKFTDNNRYGIEIAKNKKNWYSII
uniref:L-Fucosyltransferase n=1 Tax=Anopheles dirus TaxID=7168 RepID=A0A182N1M9_9DIPT